jgi:phospholipid/cholesterol/gamma-HCH transport system permease protein
VTLVEGAHLGPLPSTPPEADFNLFHFVGHHTLEFLEDVRESLSFVGELVSGLAGVLLHPSRLRWADCLLYMQRTGADALGIVALINFLMGVILAFQGVSMLGDLGFESYTPSAVAVGIILELGPLMTAILVAGRSGSAFAAEIGTMKVNEEVDALDTMGLDRMRFLVAPKVVALLVMMPLLVVFADACGVLGGLAICGTTLGMPVSQYFNEAFRHVDLWGATQGLIKGEAYAVCIAGVGCLRGLQTETGAQGVGLSTTSAVVSSILLIIVSDAVLTVIFQYVHP